MKHVNQIPLATGLAILPVSVFAGEIRRRENNPAADSAGQLLAPVMVHRGTPAEKGDYNYQVRRDEQLTKMQNDRDNAAMLRGERQAQLPPELKEVSVRTCGWQIDFDNATLAVRRVEKGSPSTHPIRGDELRALRRRAREQDLKSPFVFTSERGAPFTTAGFTPTVERAGAAAGFEFKAHPHMLRHACGSPWPTRGTTHDRLQVHLRDRNIQHTVRDTELSPERFKDFWR